jgi:hypothetical protein
MMDWTDTGKPAGVKKFAALTVLTMISVLAAYGNTHSSDTEASSQSRPSRTSVLKTKLILDLTDKFASAGRMLKKNIGKVSGAGNFSGPLYSGKYNYRLFPGQPAITVSGKKIAFSVPARLAVDVSGQALLLVSINESRGCRNNGIDPKWETPLTLNQKCQLTVGKTTGDFDSVKDCWVKVGVAGVKSLDSTINGQVKRAVDSGSRKIYQQVAKAVPSAVFSDQLLDLGEPLPLVEGIAWLSVNARAMSISRYWGKGSNLYVDLELIAEPGIAFGARPSRNVSEVPCQLSGSGARSMFTVPLTMHLPLVRPKTVDIDQSCHNAKGTGALRFITIPDKPDRAIVLIKDGSGCKPLMYLSGSSVAHRSNGTASPAAVGFDRSLNDLLADIARWLGTEGPLANVRTNARKHLQANVASLRSEFQALEKQKFDLIRGNDSMRLSLDGITVHVGSVWMDNEGISAELLVTSPVTAELRL